MSGPLPHRGGLRKGCFYAWCDAESTYWNRVENLGDTGTVSGSSLDFTSTAAYLRIGFALCTWGGGEQNSTEKEAAELHSRLLCLLQETGWKACQSPNYKFKEGAHIKWRSRGPNRFLLSLTGSLTKNVKHPQCSLLGRVIEPFSTMADKVTR